MLPWEVTEFSDPDTKGNYVFVTWVGDHRPRHVHVFRDDKCVLKWNLEKWESMEGEPSARILRLIRQLVSEGLL